MTDSYNQQHPYQPYPPQPGTPPPAWQQPPTGYPPQPGYPHPGYPPQYQQPTPPPQPPHKPGRKPLTRGQKIAGTTAAVLTLAVAATCAGLLAANDTNTPTKPTQATLDTDATSACEHFVDQRLKSPASARYSSEQVSHTGTTYVVGGNVDSQNSFGAMIRNQFVCTETLDTGNNTWHLQALDGLGN